jgi:hypothetical protein
LAHRYAGAQESHTGSTGFAYTWSAVKEEDQTTSFASHKISGPHTSRDFFSMSITASEALRK